MQIDRGALLYNLAALKDLAPKGMQIAAVVKGNAYGHGLREVAAILDGRVDMFQVDDIEELRCLRQVTQARAIVLGHVPECAMAEVVELGAELALFADWQIEPLRSIGRPVRVHLEIDVLLGRLGVLPGEVASMLEKIRSAPNIEIVAAYGHFANIEDTTDQSHAYAQIEGFEEAFALVRAAFPNAGRHMSATSGLMTIEPIRRGYNLVRLGIGLYGMYPSAPLSRTHAYLGLKPVMRWVAGLSQVKTLPAGHPVGYGLTFVAPRDMTIGVVPQGYSDGYDRGLSNTGEVLVRGRRCPVLGRIAMNMFTADLSSVPQAEAGDEVVLLGSQGLPPTPQTPPSDTNMPGTVERITAEEIALKLATINYEITTRVSPLLPRVVV